MRLSNFMYGLAILAPYFDDQEGHHVGAEHDQFYVYPTDRPVGPRDLERLIGLGWFQPEAEEGAAYDPAEGWSCFV